VRNTHLYLLVALLILTTGAIFAFKVLRLGFPLAAAESAQLWEFEARIRFSGLGGPAKFTLQVPSRGGGYVIADESFFSGRYGLSTRYVDGNRQAVWSTRSARGRQTLFYRAAIQTAPAATPTSRCWSATAPAPRTRWRRSRVCSRSTA